MYIYCVGDITAVPTSTFLCWVTWLLQCCLGYSGNGAGKQDFVRSSLNVFVQGYDLLSI